MTKTKDTRRNFRAFLWHAVFLALASNFMDVDTVIPAMLIQAGGNEIHLGFLTAIMLGGSRLMQLVFASYLGGKQQKRPFLLLGINVRVIALFSMAFLFFTATSLPGAWTIVLIFVLITIFSLSGAFAGVSYIDILGKAIERQQRKSFFTMKQMLNSAGILISAFVVRELLRYFDYPLNYSSLFLGAAILLGIASLGFWQIREPHTQTVDKKGFMEFLRMIPKEIRYNTNLKYYLLIINVLGLGLSFLPFLIIFAKENFEFTGEMVGNFLIFRVSGMLLASLLLYKLERRLRYKNILRLSIWLGLMIPLIALMLQNHDFWYQFLFILSGIFVASYKISLDGILIEISNETNRTTYAGIAGAGNILSVIFPLVAGFLIAHLGYTAVFISVAVIIAVSYFFTFPLNCSITAEHE